MPKYSLVTSDPLQVTFNWDEVPRLKVASYKQILRIFFVVIHTIYEIETLIIENENYEAQLQSANSEPIPQFNQIYLIQQYPRLRPLLA